MSNGKEKKIANCIKPSENVDVPIIGEDRQEPLVVIPLSKFLKNNRRKMNPKQYQLGNDYYGISYLKFNELTDIGINIYPFAFAVNINFIIKPILGFTFSFFFLNISIYFSISDSENLSTE